MHTEIAVEYALETMQGAWWGHAGHAGPIDSSELNLRYIEGDGGGLQTCLHYFQGTSQYGTYCSPTSGTETEMEKMKLKY